MVSLSRKLLMEAMALEQTQAWQSEPGVALSLQPPAGVLSPKLLLQMQILLPCQS